jgi:hypothetical protein
VASNGMAFILVIGHWLDVNRRNKKGRAQGDKIISLSFIFELEKYANFA